jgi:hypothetical protein
LCNSLDEKRKSLRGGRKIVQALLPAPRLARMFGDVERDEAAEDRRRRERIRANAALLGLPPLTPSEFRAAARDPVTHARLRAMTPRQRAVTVAVFVVGLVPLLAAAIFTGSGQKHIGAVILLVWVLLGPAWYLVLLIRALLIRVRRSR